MLGQDLICRHPWNYKCEGHGNCAGEHNSRSALRQSRISERIAFRLPIVVSTAARVREQHLASI